MVYIYYFLVICVMIAYLRIILINLRLSLLIGLIFTTFTLGALPWEVIPLDGIAFGAQLFFIFSAIIYFFARKDVSAVFFINKYNLALMILALILIAYLPMSENISYGISKTFFFVTKGLLPVLAVGLLSPLKEKDIRYILFVIIVGSLLVVIKLFSFADLSAERAVISDESSPITIARYIGLGITLLSYYLFFVKKRSVVTLLFTIAFLCMAFYGILITGTRGPILGILFGLIGVSLFFSSGFWSRLKFLMKITIILLILISSLWVLARDVDSYPSVTRIVNYLSTIGSNTSDQARIQRYKVAINGFVKTKTIGVGTGGFAKLYDSSERNYPHNLFLEVLVEQGIIGIIILILIVWLPFYKAFLMRLNDRTMELIKPLIALWLFTLFNSFVSLDIAGNYMLWILGAIIYYSCQSAKLGNFVGVE